MSDPAILGRVAQSVDGTRILDVGCGAGLLGFILRNNFLCTAAYKDRNVWLERLDGLDFDSFITDRLSKTGIYDSVICQDSARLSVEKNFYDCVLSIENVEHLYLDEVEDAIAQLVEATTDQVLISTPPPDCCFAHSFPFYAQEMEFLEKDREPMSYSEFMKYTGWFHKTSIHPASLIESGFVPLRDAQGRQVLIQGGTCLYSLRKRDFRPLKLKTFGMKNPRIERVDTKDYREEYRQFIACILDMIGCVFDGREFKVVRQVRF